MKVIFCGDSTMQINDETTYPQKGWPQALEKRFNNDVELINLAKNGRSTKSYLEEGLFEQSLKLVDENSLVVMEFGHNDEHTHQPERFTRPYIEYKDNLTFMIKKVQEQKGQVLLLTPIYRRHFLEDGSLFEKEHEDYRLAMLEVAKENNVDIIDMCLLTKEAIRQMGDEASKQCFMNFAAHIYPNYPDGLNDNTHLRSKGAHLVAAIFLQEMIKNNHFLTSYLI